jgi:hypothetical protein
LVEIVENYKYMGFVATSAFSEPFQVQNGLTKASLFICSVGIVLFLKLDSPLTIIAQTLTVIYSGPHTPRKE